MPPSNRRPIEREDVELTALPDVPKAAPIPAQAETVVLPKTAPAFKQPCTLKGATSALYAGMLGYFLGVVPATIKFKARQWGMIHTQGLASAQQLAIMSGMYTAVHCICQRIRMVEDGWNRGVAGCSTGLVLGWSNGPWGALQSCAGLGLISALIDFGGGVEAAEARVLQPVQEPLRGYQQQQQQRQLWQPQQQRDQQLSGASQLLSGLPQPAQLLALQLGAPPSSLHAAAGSSSHPQLLHAETGLPVKQQQQQQPGGMARRSSQQLDPLLMSSGTLGVVPHQQQQLQGYPQAPPLLQPVAMAVQQLMSAPPLMFLGACCHSNAATASGAAAAAADIDACPLGALHSARGGGKP